MRTILATDRGYHTQSYNCIEVVSPLLLTRQDFNFMSHYILYSCSLQNQHPWYIVLITIVGHDCNEYIAINWEPDLTFLETDNFRIMWKLCCLDHDGKHPNPLYLCLHKKYKNTCETGTTLYKNGRQYTSTKYWKWFRGWVSTPDFRFPGSRTDFYKRPYGHKFTYICFVERWPNLLPYRCDQMYNTALYYS